MKTNVVFHEEVSPQCINCHNVFTCYPCIYSFIISPSFNPISHANKNDGHN